MLINKLKHTAYTISGAVCSLGYAVSSFAGGAIPTPPSNQQINSGQDTLAVTFNIFKTEVAPILFYGTEMLLIVIAIWVVIGGVKKAKDRDDWSHFKTAVVVAAVLVTVGMVLGYFGMDMLGKMKLG